jgi:hypothetical protein
MISFETTQHLAMALCVGRVLVGLAPIVAANTTSRLMGFPPESNTATARLFARMFGVRDAALGVLVWHFLPDLAQLRWLFLFNAAMDLGDALAALSPLLRRRGIDRAAGTSLAAALFGGSAFVVLYFISG